MMTVYFFYVERLRRSMQKERKDIEQFVVPYNGIQIDCILDIGCDPLELMIGIAGRNFACVLYLRRDPESFKYLCDMPDKIFYELRKKLDLCPDPENPFTSFNFLRYIDNHLPIKASPEIVDPAALLQFRKDRLSDSSREEGLIFWRWLRHEGANNGHVTAQNLEKTRLLLGASASEFCREHDISSQWTTDTTKAGPLTRPQD